MRVHRPVGPKSTDLAHLDEALAGGLLGLDRNGVFQIAQHHVDRFGQFGHLGAQLFHMRRHEMDHALQPHRQIAHGGGRADGQRLKELAGQFHGISPFQNATSAV